MLWLDGDMEKEIVEYCMIVYLFGVGLFFVCVNYVLKCIVDDNEDEYGIVGGSLYILKNLDVFKLLSIEDEVIKIVNNVIE